MEIVVGRVGRAHGIRGEVRVETRTDSVDRRFAVGARLRTDRTGHDTLTVRSTRPHPGTLLVRFAGIHDRAAADALRGATLFSDVPEDERPDDAEEYYDRQLVGLAARRPDGAALGELVDVLHLPEQEVLVVRTPAGSEVLVPFVEALVPRIDLDEGHLVVDDGPGLFEES